ncbi:MAG: beta-xylosidase [Clostridia bacterium]|nr:beta-xylosidase [Clostridia bacterium]
MAVQYGINLKEEGRAYPHYWELCVGSCHAATVLRADVQEQIRRAHREIGFKYLRFHGLLDDDMSVVIQGMLPGAPSQISFFNIDRIFDFLLDTGMKPFVELGFMPEAYASTPQTTFHYKGFSSMPKKDEDWSNLITLLIAHLEERYGAAEVRSWFFEVWNEPNLRFFFDGTMKDYFHLYELTARAIKSVDRLVRVGGPATSNNMWIPEFRAFCEGNGIPLDFITTHHYPSDDPLSRAGMNTENEKGAGFAEVPDLSAMSEEERAKVLKTFEELFHRENRNPRDVLFQTARKVKEEAGDYPVYYTEWNAGHYDTSYAAAGVAATLAYNEGLVEGYSYWCVSDIFEEMGLHGLPFNNEFGLVNVYGTRKPVYRLFEQLHQAGDRRLSVENQGASRTAEVLPLSDGNVVTLFVYNHDIEARDIRQEQVVLHLRGKIQSLAAARIDSGNTNPLGCWEAQGKPDYPSKAQLAEMECASQLVWKNVPFAGEENEISLDLEPESVVIVKAVLA